MHNPHVTVIGGGLAGAEAAYQAARQGVPVRLVEMRPAHQTPLHCSALLGELVGSNCFAVDRPDRASGLLMAELRRMGSLVMDAAAATRLSTDGVLCVDRLAFAQHITRVLEQCPNVEICRDQATVVPAGGPAVVATGPVTSSPIARSLFALTGREYRFHYGATEPLFCADSVDLEHTWLQCRFDDQPSYRNCALDEDAFERFCAVLAETGTGLPEAVDGRQVYREHIPLEALAAHDGVGALLSGPLNSAGLVMPGSDRRPFAVCQMCPDDADESVLRPVNVRTGLPAEQQRRLFSTIRGLRAVEFVRYGTLQRAVCLNPAGLIEPTYQLTCKPEVFLAGAMTGLQGYLAAAASGCIAGIGAARVLQGLDPIASPPETLSGAMSRALAGATEASFEPLQVTFGILAPPDGNSRMSRQERRSRQLEEAMDGLDRFMNSVGVAVPEL